MNKENLRAALSIIKEGLGEGDADEPQRAAHKIDFDDVVTSDSTLYLVQLLRQVAQRFYLEGLRDGVRLALIEKGQDIDGSFLSLIVSIDAGTNFPAPGLGTRLAGLARGRRT